MRVLIIASLAGVAALAAGSAFAQNAATGDTAVNPPAAGAEASSQVNLNPPGGYASSDSLGDASKLKAGDANVVSNGPVPDTRENRAKYGRPMSQAGRHTHAAGN